MKNLLTALTVVLLLISISCTKVDINENDSRQNSEKQILEITSNFRGLWWMNGKVLDFRLYDNGTAEYDEYQTYRSPNGRLQAEAVKNLKQIKLSEVEQQEILALLAEDEFSKIETNIKQKKSCIDADINTEITVSLKDSSNQITINGHCSTIADKKSTTFFFDNFPPKLNQLFEIIKEIKNKESAGKFYN